MYSFSEVLFQWRTRSVKYSYREVLIQLSPRMRELKEKKNNFIWTVHYGIPTG